MKHTVFCKEGWYYLVVLLLFFIGAVVREVNLLLLLASLLIGPLLLNWRLVILTMRELKVRRTMPGAVGADEPWVVRIEVENGRRKLATRALVAEQTVRRLTASHTQGDKTRKLLRPAVYFPFIPTGDKRIRTFEGRFPQRGVYEVGPIQISTRFPFGLFRREQRIGESQPLIVYPHIGRISPDWTIQRHSETDDSTQRKKRHSRISGDFFGVREWGTGDSQRWIHWRSSARHGKIVVRQFEQPQNRDVAVFLDLWLPGKHSRAQRENVELAVSFTATLIHDVGRQGGCRLTVGIAQDEEQDKLIRNGAGNSEKNESAGEKDPNRRDEKNGEHSEQAEEPTLPSAETRSKTANQDSDGLIIESGPVSSILVERAMEHLAIVEPSSIDRLPQLLERSLRTVDPNAEIVIVSTRPVEISDRHRFAQLHNDPTLRLGARRIRVADTSDHAIETVYEP